MWKVYLRIFVNAVPRDHTRISHAELEMPIVQLQREQIWISALASA